MKSAWLTYLARSFVLIALMIGVQPSVPVLALDGVSQNGSRLVSPRHRLETLTVAGFCDKKEFSKPTLGLIGTCGPSHHLDPIAFTFDQVQISPSASVLTYSHNRSPPPALLSLIRQQSDHLSRPLRVWPHHPKKCVTVILRLLSGGGDPSCQPRI